MLFEGDNPWYLNELAYDGQLYHYTDEAGYRGIIDPNKNFDDNITLRLTRIDCLSKDPQERQHIQETVKAVAERLKDEGSITADFYEAVISYPSTNTGFSMCITDTWNQETRNNVVSMSYGKVDYYIGCFSTDPNNEHIIKEFSSTRNIKFNRYFSLVDNSQKLQQFKINSFSLPNYYTACPPYTALHSSFLEYYMKKVLYQAHEKEELIRKALLEISNSPSDFQLELEQMYYLYDGFFKAKKFEEEKEVRLLVKVPQMDQAVKQLEENHIRFEDGENEPKKYLYLPISFKFLEEGSLAEIKREQTHLTCSGGY